MGHLKSTLRSSVGKKFFMGISGLALVGFVAFHLLENMLLFTGNKTLYNQWTHILESLGPALYVLEAGLVLFFLVHIQSGISVWLDNYRARPQGYKKSAAAGGPSLKSSSSVSMILTGLILVIFIVLHVSEFKYGPNVAEGYVQVVDGVELRDMHRLVVETFSQPAWVVFYVAIMTLLAMHLRHGFWSAFQSLGLMNAKLTPLAHGIGVLVAILLGLGFIALPVWIYFTGGGV